MPWERYVTVFLACSLAQGASRNLVSDLRSGAAQRGNFPQELPPRAQGHKVGFNIRILVEQLLSSRASFLPYSSWFPLQQKMRQRVAAALHARGELVQHVAQLDAQQQSSWSELGRETALQPTW